MQERRRTVLWALIGVTVIVLAVPWFLWGSDRVVAGLPVWIWWHVGWLGVTSVVFCVFTRRAWGLGVETGGDHRG